MKLRTKTLSATTSCLTWEIIGTDKENKDGWVLYYKPSTVIWVADHSTILLATTQDQSMNTLWCLYCHIWVFIPSYSVHLIMECKKIPKIRIPLKKNNVWGEKNWGIQRWTLGVRVVKFFSKYLYPIWKDQASHVKRKVYE
jgi:hypothetical protein